MSLLGDIEQLARQERGLPEVPFFRRQFGGWAYKDMQTRESLFAAVVDIYEGNGRKYIDPMPSKGEGEARNQPGRIEVPLLMSFVNKWNNLYSKDPTRVFTYKGERLSTDDPNGRILADYYNRAMTNSVLEQADNLLRLTGNVAIRPYFDSENDSLVHHLYGSQSIRVIPNSKNAMAPKAVALVGRYKKPDADGGTVFVDEAEYFTAENYGRLDGAKASNSKLETKHVPVVYGWERIPTGNNFYVNCPGPGLAAIDRLIANDFTSELGFITIMQGFGIPVTWGMKKGQKFKIGPDRTIDFAGDPETKEDLEFKNPNAPLDDIVGVIKAIIDWVRECYDIPKSMLDAGMSPSGVATIEANAPLGILRDKRATTFRPIEQRLVIVVADILISAGVLPASLDPKQFGVSVYYPESKIVRSTGDQIAKDRFDLETGIVTPATIYMRDNPDQFDNEDEAQVFLASRSAGGGEPTGVEGELPDTPVPADKDVQNQAMNGAQVSSLLEILAGVSENRIAPEAAKLAITVAFPLVPTDIATKMIEAQTSVQAKETNNGRGPEQPAPNSTPGTTPAPKAPGSTGNKSV